MISVAICEDSPEKLADIRLLLTAELEPGSFEISAFMDIKSARSAFRVRQFDVVILDASLPPSPDEPAKGSAGLDLLVQITQSTRYIPPRYVIFLSAFREEVDRVRANPSGRYWNVIHYSRSSQAWREQLLRQLEYIVSTTQRRAEGFQYDAVFITALDSPEYDAFRGVELGWIERPGQLKCMTCEINADGRRLRFAVVSASQMGCTAAAVLAYRSVEEFRPRVALMSGIAAGVASQCGIGDVLAADPCWEWGSGKYVEVRGRLQFEQAPTQLRASPELLVRLRDSERIRRHLRDIHDQWPGEKPAVPPMLRIGPVVSGAAVVASSKMVTTLKKQHRKLIGIEMESYGVYYACEALGSFGTKCVSLKSVCDFADKKKDDRYQTYAAFVSARFCLAFAKDYVSTSAS